MQAVFLYIFLFAWAGNLLYFNVSYFIKIMNFQQFWSQLWFTHMNICGLTYHTVFVVESMEHLSDIPDFLLQIFPPIFAKNLNPPLVSIRKVWWKKERRVSWDGSFKGTVSRDLRWVLLYINWKLFSRAIVAHHKMLILLKGHFTLYKRRSSVRTAWWF